MLGGVAKANALANPIIQTIATKLACDEVINNEIYKLNKPEDVISINITPYINPDKADEYYFPICFYLSYVYRWEID